MAADPQTGLISMAEIARLAGQSRSTVGNWKKRNDDFPKERGSNQRGPLYDRNEMLDWLRNTGRLTAEDQADKLVWQAMEALRGALGVGPAADLLLVLLGVKVAAERQSPEVWQEVVREPGTRTLGRAVHDLLPFVSELFVPPAEGADEGLCRALALLGSVDTGRAGDVAVLDGIVQVMMMIREFGNAAAEYVSPWTLRQLMVRLAEPRGTVYDPAAGFCQLLVDAAASSTDRVELYAQDVNRRTWEVGTLNFFLRGIEADYRLGDTFAADAFPGLLADIVLTNPPFGLHIPVLEQLQNDPRWVFGEPGPRDSNAAWIQHCLHHLAPRGSAFVVLPNSALFEGGRGGRVRQRVIKAGLLDAVVALPAGLFLTTNIPTALFVFEKDRVNRGGQSSPGPVLMFDASGLGEKHGRSETYLPEDALKRVTDTYRAWRARGHVPSDPQAAVVEFEVIAENNFVVDPRRYVAGTLVTTSETQLLEQRRRVLRSLVDAIGACSAADAALLQDFGGEQ